MAIEEDSPLYQELVLRSKIMECCKSCRHYTIKYDDDYCTKHWAFIYGCPCNKKEKYLLRFGLSQNNLDWDVSFLPESKTKKTNRKFND
jgi:hypothetical protein